MAQNTFPAFTNMMPVVEDIQLIVDSLKQEDRFRITKDGIFTPGIVNGVSDYLSAGSRTNSLKIKPFTAYTANGNRINVEYTYDDLYAQGSVINVTSDNIVSTYENIPVWNPFTVTYENLDQSSTTQAIKLTSLGRGSILHGIKVRINSLFNIPSSSAQPNVYVSIGTQVEPDKFLPSTPVSESSSSTSLSVMNLMYSFDDANLTDIYVTFTSDSINLNTLTNGALTINLCIANLSGFDNEDISQTEGGFELSNTQTQWQASTTYYIVARYMETALSDSIRGLNYTTSDGTVITTVPEPTRYRTGYKFYALRKTGSVIDSSTLDDVKLGEIVTDANRNIVAININGKNNSGNDYTDYLTLPGYRFVDGINANQIGNGDVNNTQFSYLNSLTGNVQGQLNSKAGLTADNTFEGNNTFTQQINGSIDKVNGFEAHQTPTANSLLVLDENGKVPGDAISEVALSNIGSLYTISTGVTTNGRASFLAPKTDFTGVTVLASEENPLVLNYPDGSTEKLTSNVDVSGISANGHYYLVKEKNGNFVFLPTAGGTMACIPVVGSGNTFTYKGTSGGVVVSYYSNATAYQAFDGTLTTGTKMGQITYTNYHGTETFAGLPDGSTTPTYLVAHFPIAVEPTACALCFNTKDTSAAIPDATPKAWKLQATNDDYDDESAVWTTLYENTPAIPATWNKDEIKLIYLAPGLAYKNFRVIFNVKETDINNYLVGQQTDNDGVTMPINCYYFQIYATNTDTSIKGEIVEGYIKPSTMSAGSYFLDISKKPYKGYKCVSTNTFSDVTYVKLGFVDAVELSSVNAKIECYPFCYNTYTVSDNKTTWILSGSDRSYTTEISKNTPITFDHNLGLIPNVVNVKFVCLSANNGYSIGDYIDNIYALETIEIDSDDSITEFTNIKDSISITTTSIKIYPGTATSTLFVKHKTTGSLVPTSNGKWGIIIYCSRGW